MSGNVWEWTGDWYSPTYYATSPRDNPTGPSTGDRRVLRGGSFTNEPFDLRTTYRNHLPPDHRGYSKGLRLVRARPRKAPAPATLVAAAAAIPPEALGTVAVAAPPPPPHREALTGMELVHVSGGCFQMGDLWHDASESMGEGPDEQPIHEVCVGDFYLGRYEVTRGEWRAVMGSDPSSRTMCAADRCPVDNVTFDAVQEFIRRLNAKEGGSRYRLPTEAEWEYAARSGGRAERYAGGNDVDSVSWNYATTAHGRPDEETRPVGTKEPNGLGLYDMSGNVYEITNDVYDGGYYAKSPRDNPRGPASATGSAHVKRGGCASGGPRNSRVARRVDWTGPNPLTGFRLARTP
jgi:formylglycine-generating enzyme required for sulfatase activity